MKLRVIERLWDVPRRRYAVERLNVQLADGFQAWSVLCFKPTALEAQLAMSRAANWAEISSREDPDLGKGGGALLP